ncbi:hypothetical protein MWU59_12215 [Flavobacteriaceae bacterium F08102]|nr:hypothetical protein [Flavobacteriaceae bacterium F08102]
MKQEPLKIKDKIKLSLFPILVKLLHAVGFSYKKLGYSVFNKSIPLVQAEKLGQMKPEKSSKPQNIFVLLMLPGSSFHLYIEGLLALALKKKGHNVTIIFDDNTLPVHEMKKIGNEENWEYQEKYNVLYASKFLTNLKLDFIKVSDFIDSTKSYEYNEKYDAILEASLLKQYKVGVLSNDLPNFKEKKELFKKAIALTDAIGRKLVDLKVDKVIMSHGIYSTWGPPFEVLTQNNIPTLVHGRGKMRHSQVFNWNKTGDSWDVSEEWERVKDKELTPKEMHVLNDYLDSRISHKNDVYVYNFGKETSQNETIANLGLDPNKPIYTLFTNVLWDAASAQREIAFKNPVEWVLETIAWFNDHPEKQLIVKIHPAEVVIGTKMPFYDIIMDNMTPNQNVKIIKPDAKVNSWSIYDITDLGIVHTTTAGMELPLVNKPCLVVSRTHYRNKGFTVDINSKAEYFEVLADFKVENYNLDKNKQEALKYAYLLFIRYQIPFNMFYEENTTDIRGFRKGTIEEYLKEPVFAKIIESIEFKKPLFFV